MRTWMASAGRNQAIERRGTPVCKSYRANDARATGMRIGQSLRGTSNNTGSKSAQPGQSGQIVRGCSIKAHTSFGARYDTAATRHTNITVCCGEIDFLVFHNGQLRPVSTAYLPIAAA